MIVTPDIQNSKNKKNKRQLDAVQILIHHTKSKYIIFKHFIIIYCLILYDKFKNKFWNIYENYWIMHMLNLKLIFIS